MDLSTAVWRKSSRSSNNGGDCVEVARISDTVAIRDSKNPHGAKLLLTPHDFKNLTRSLKNA
ncbi:DUF397 domain-containing protein [Actinomadura livida]|uniref:DUF397 domain-containing protein n=1 Tax=Actinomadura livida TaxID=79909 RepID=A0A7W7I9X5_9ACTN|nr:MULTISPECIES: DUF397 domain-containing protein [Actinomadura]MBB4773140.1 hypothetical protein [Actinomadura catellatispora]GGU18274.1 hypothetical protein GCM10010208_49250 [Actinomadura livida]